MAALYSLRSGYHAVIVRRAFGVGGAFLVDCGCAHDAGVNFRVAWPSAETGSLPLDGGIGLCLACV
jgi:acetyl-CoA carboxylase carboxyltransferase component